MTNPLFDDAFLAFSLRAHGLPDLLARERFAHLDEESAALFLEACRGVARDKLLPSYAPLDHTPGFDGSSVTLDARFSGLFDEVAELGILSMRAPESEGGAALPELLATTATLYLMAGNLSVFGAAGLTVGAANLIASFGDEAVRDAFLEPMRTGRFTGTMALTEPDAGSSLGDLTTRATPADDGTYRLVGNKIFISGGDGGAAENVVHLVLARIEGAPAGSRGISLFAVPRERPEGDAWVPNDVRVAGIIPKIGWKALPSVMLAFGDEDDCYGWIVGPPNRGLAQMFQMMNEARLMVGANGVATAAVAFRESLAYARDRKQGRAPGHEGPAPLLAHPDVRRMLWRQKAIVDGGTSLVMAAARLVDDAASAATPEARAEAEALLGLLTPLAKSFPAEWGFESNALAVQIHGGYGYSSEYRVEAFLRDQKLNSIHEGTTGIQALDFLGRKVLRDGGEAFGLLGQRILADVARADAAGLSTLAKPLARSLGAASDAAKAVGMRAAGGDPAALAGATEFMMAACAVVVSWQLLFLAIEARERLEAGPLRRGIEQSAASFLREELPIAETRFAAVAAGSEPHAEADDEAFGPS